MRNSAGLEVSNELVGGPVLVTIEYSVVAELESKFVKAMHQYARVRRRDSAYRWGIYRDVEVANRFVEVFLVHSWAEHLRQHERQTKADRELEQRVYSYVVGEPKVRHLRSSVNAFDDPRVAGAIEATKRKKLIFAGISLEVCAAFPAITAVGKGLDAYVAVDASGTFSETKRQAGLLRMLQAGVIVSDYTTLMVEILKDNARPEAGEVYEAMDMGWAKLVGQIAQSYGR
jgi:nicotinamidase-related amidase